MMAVLGSANMVILLQYISISNQRNVYLKFTQGYIHQSYLNKTRKTLGEIKYK